MPNRSLLSVALLLSATCACTPERSVTTVGAASAPGAPVKVASVELRMLPVEIKAIGNVEAYATVLVKPHITGTLLKAYFDEGAMVREGDTLFEIDARPYKEAVRQWEANLLRDRALLLQAEANLARAQTQEAHSAKQLDRYEKLAAEGILSREQADQIGVEARTRRSNVQAETAAADSARASIAAAEASLDNAKLNLSYCTVRAPISGRTGSMTVKPGNLVKANDADLVTIHQIAPLYVTFTVPEAKLLTLRGRVGNASVPVTAAIPDDPRDAVRAAVTFLDNMVDAGTGTIRLKATFGNSDKRLWPGQFVNVRVLLEERSNALVIPASALQTGQAGNFVYVVKPDETIELRPVTPGVAGDRVIAIERGLQAGERVVVEGHLRIAPGVKARVVS